MINRKPRVFSAKKLPDHARHYLEEMTDFKMWNHIDPMPHDLMMKEIGDIDGLITGSAINHELLEQAPKLRVVSTISVGYNQFDIEAMRERGIIGTHTPYVLDDSVADLIMGLMLSAARRIPELDALTKSGGWIKGNDIPLFGREVHHKTLGIIGMGRIGEVVAKRAKFGFDMEVSYYNRSRKLEVEEKLDIKYSTMELLLKESDFIVVMVPLSKETTNLIGAREFKLMKKTAIFINASRGQTVDEPALNHALENNEIYAAGLDVFHQEPIDPTNPLLKLSNVITLPHIGSATQETRDAMALCAAKNMVAGLTGAHPIDVVKELQDLVK